ncbi:MAG: hypothetical protein FWE29_04220, partial [Defluviitaleaceae bacterium]|nr:hypothetical protein [Defluviitaleaceae bacterium]
MKIFLNRTFSALLLVLLTVGLAACDRGQSDENGNLNQPTVNQPNDITDSQPPTDQPHQWTLEELGATIEAAGEFWNDWWGRSGVFAWEHIDDSRRNWQPWYEEIAPIHHPLSRGFSILLPSSGFTSLNDIGDYLLQFYTQSWVDKSQFGETRVAMEAVNGNYYYLFGVLYAFEEYDGYLYIFTMNESVPRPDWTTATHTLIEQAGSHAVIETVVTVGVQGYYSEALPTITYRFTFIDGRIDSGTGQWKSPETDTSQIYEWGGHSATLGDMFIFIHREEDVIIDGIIERLHLIYYPGFLEESTEQGDSIFIEATEPIYDVSLVHFSNDWDDSTEEIIYILTDSLNIADIIVPGEGILVHGYMSRGTLPWSGISFYDTQRKPRERYFFAINHDNSDSHNWFMIPLQYNVQHGFELEIFIPAFVKSPCLTLVRLRSLFVAGIKI